tara:strand:- start:18556 stop:18690 length:135 start_codon:yes stop_codon:yes gene_type:complete
MYEYNIEDIKKRLNILKDKKKKEKKKENIDNRINMVNFTKNLIY